MQVLSLTQPWATLICLGAKKIETRSWKTSYAGPLFIHAAKSFPRWAREFASEPPVSVLLGPGYDYPIGCIIGAATLVRCVPTAGFDPGSAQERAFGDYSDGRFAWILKDGHFLPQPIPAKGSLGIWTFNPEGQTETDCWRQSPDHPITRSLNA